jgi:hypothetical protein
MMESKNKLTISRAFLGQFAKEVVDLELHYTEESLELFAIDSSASASLPSPWLWKNITGINPQFNTILIG